MRSCKLGVASVLAISAVVLLGPALAAVGTGARFSSYLGGSDIDRPHAVAVDSTGATYVAGTTFSTDFPVKAALYGSLAGGSDAFVAKIAPDGKSVLWATYLGGTGADEALAVSLDAAGVVWVAGSTASTDFPTQAALQDTPAGGRDGFLARIESDGGTLLSSTYLGGDGDDRALAMGLDGAGNVWLAGTTDSDDLPVTFDAAQPSLGGETDAFVAEVSADGSSLVRATYLGGTGTEGAVSMAVEASGSVTVVGSTVSGDFPVANALQAYPAGGSDGFITRFDGLTGQILFSTYFGGGDDDAPLSVASDGSGVLLVGGSTRSTDLPVSGAMQDTLAGGSDAFLLSLSTDGGTVQFATYLGGADDDEVRAVAFSQDGSPVAAGATASSDFPEKAGVQTASGGGVDGFLVRLSKSGSTLAYGTYLGGAGQDGIAALAVDSLGHALVAGETDSPDFPLLTPFQAAQGGDVDGFAARMLLAPAVPENLGLMGISHLQVTISWSDPSDGRASFEVQRSPADGAWETVAFLPPGTTSWTDTDVQPQTAYDYRIRALIDGVPSDYTSMLVANTLAIPAPAVPGTPVLEVLSSRSILVQWSDESDDEITFEIFRSADGGPWTIARSMTAGSTSWQDNGVTANRTWSYEVRAVGVAGPSSFSGAATAATPATFDVAVDSGKRTDSSKTARDSVSLLARLTSLEGAAALDPVASGFQVGIGGTDQPAILSIQPGAEGWKVRDGVYTWKSPKGSIVKAKLVVDTVKGTVRLKASHLQLPAAVAGDLRTWIRSGSDAGSVESPWAAAKTGVLVAQ